MTATAFVPVVLAGGSGERFWPLSRKSKPKQFLALDGTGRSLIQATTDRLAPLSDGLERLMIVTAHAHRGLILEHLPDLPIENLIVEPASRDSAAAVLYGALRVRERFGEDAVVGILPSDHRIGNPLAFQDAVMAAVEAAALEDAVVTLGMNPSYPATSYGYVESGGVVREIGPHRVHSVRRFTEKPDARAAEAFVQSGRHHWNAGMFFFRASVMLAEFARHAPELLAALEPAVHSGSRAALSAAYERLEKISIDYAIMERSDRVLVICAEFEWDDLGDFNALERLLRSSNPNVAVGQHLGLDTTGAILYTTTGDDLIVTIGLEDVVIVRDGNATLVVRKDRTQDIKQIVQRLKAIPELERYT